MARRGRQVVFGIGAVVGMWLLIELVSAGALAVLPDPTEVSDLQAADPEWLVNAKSAYAHGFFIHDNHTLWRPRPGHSSGPSPASVYGTRALVLNSHGHRGPEIPVQKPPGVRRILLVGGSHPYGMWVETEEAYIAQVGQLLDAREGPGTWEVINAACPGYTTFQGVAFVREYGIAFEPDVVIFDLGMNDSLPLSVQYAAPDHEVAAVPGFVNRAVAVAGGSAVYRLLRRVLQPVAGAADVQAVRVSPDQTRANRQAIEALGAEHDFRVLHVTQVSSDVGPGGPASCQDTVEGFANVADVCSTFGDLGLDSGLYFHDPIHANAAGHALIAQTILAKLDALGWVD